MDHSALDAAHAAAVQYLENVGWRPVGASADAASMRAALGGPLPEQGESPARQVGWRELALGAVLPVLMAATGGRASVRALLATVGVSAIIALWLRSRLGGYTGDTLGLCACLCEVASLSCFL